MGMPTWWDERRFGLIVHATIASVPAWAPIGQQSEWYRRHLGEGVAGSTVQPAPMVEVVAHHRDRWGHIERYDDFLDLLTFESFDAEQWARLANDAGAGYSVMVAKHHDGLCWWDAPATDATVVTRGPRRNVLAEFAAACERNGIVFGTYYSTLDWTAPHRQAGDDEAIVRSRVVDLADRYGSKYMWGDRPAAADAHDATDTNGIVEELRAIDPEIVVNDRWGPPTSGGGECSGAVRTFDFDPPDDITPGPWELRRGIGHSLGHNRNERPEHHMAGYDIVALLTEVIAKGGHLLLCVGPAADGSIPDAQSAPLRDAGTWIRAQRNLIARAEPWTTWGDDEVRYVTADGVLHAFDLAGRGKFTALDPSRVRVVAVQRVSESETNDMHFVQDDDGLRIDLPRSTPWRRGALPIHGAAAVDVAVYRIDTVDVEDPAELFEPIDRTPIALAPLLDDATAGDIVQLGDGTYCGPAVVPPGVILRGLGPSRTVVEADTSPTLTLGRHSRVEHLTVRGSFAPTDSSSDPAVAIDGQFASLLGCAVDGRVAVTADDTLVRATRLAGIRATGADRLTVSRCQLHGSRWDVGVHLDGGADHDIDSCEIVNHLCAIRASATTGTVARGNTIEARWWGVHLERTERAHVHGNRITRTMRAVDIDGGSSAVVDGNAVTDGDSGCVVERGAANSHVAGNHWERCRIGLLAWDATGLHEQDNQAFALHEPGAVLVTGP